MQKKLLIIGGATIIAAVGLRTLYKNIYLAGQWDFNMGTFNLEGTKPFTISQTIEFINKSNLKIDIRNVNLGVFTNGARIGTIKEPAEQIISGKGISKFKVNYVLNPSLNNQKTTEAISKAVASYLQTKDIPIDFVGYMEVKTPFGFTQVPIRWSSTGKNLYNLWYQYMYS
jgi:LEA14-like dessication related protein